MESSRNEMMSLIRLNVPEPQDPEVTLLPSSLPVTLCPEDLRKFRTNVLMLASSAVKGYEQCNPKHVQEIPTEIKTSPNVVGDVLQQFMATNTSPDGRSSPNEKLVNMLKVFGMSKGAVTIRSKPGDHPNEYYPGRKLALKMMEIASRKYSEPQSSHARKLVEGFQRCLGAEFLTWTEDNKAQYSKQSFLVPSEFQDLVDQVESMLMKRCFPLESDGKVTYGAPVLSQITEVLLQGDRSSHSLMLFKKALIMIVADLFQVLNGMTTTHGMKLLLGNRLEDASLSLETLQSVQHQVATFADALFPLLCYGTLCSMTKDQELLTRDNLLALSMNWNNCRRVVIHNSKDEQKDQLQLDTLSLETPEADEHNGEKSTKPKSEEQISKSTPTNSSITESPITSSTESPGSSSTETPLTLTTEEEMLRMSQECDDFKDGHGCKKGCKCSFKFSLQCRKL